ncbi:aldose epimerase family protein [Silvimonas iriomotensis]|uniref:Aldose 1-epimerase n=1 Tax=Silvimonas iriomotensis TaxID=449662 RepID=A0ABQ2PF50_9NEIS|nr:aldose epimerase family protein [Silvimonas iriomotensis]GGP23890.1 aldose 1-epimerase [Silvimonas iriomotensis]
MSIQSAPWDHDATLYTLENAHGMRMLITDVGASLVSWFAPDRDGNMSDIVLGHDNAAGYLSGAGFFGCIAGRWANRIKGARCTIDGQQYIFTANEGANLLHGGDAGFHTQRWQGHILGNSLQLTLTSPAGAAGFPGNLQVWVEYELADDGTLTLTYGARTDAPTPVNLTNHVYFNLAGGAADIRAQQLQVNAGRYLAIDHESIPVDMARVDGTPLDLRQPVALGEVLAMSHPQLGIARGLDHCYVPEGEPGTLRQVATLFDPASGRELITATTERGIQVYTGNFLEGTTGRRAYHAHDGVCLETQAFPDQVNMPSAHEVILRPGQTYRQITTYRATVRS